MSLWSEENLRQKKCLTSLLEGLGRPTKRGVRRCPNCGFINGLRSYECKNISCQQRLKMNCSVKSNEISKKSWKESFEKEKEVITNNFEVFKLKTCEKIYSVHKLLSDKEGEEEEDEEIINWGLVHVPYFDNLSWTLAANNIPEVFLCLASCYMPECPASKLRNHFSPLSPSSSSSSSSSSHNLEDRNKKRKILLNGKKHKKQSSQSNQINPNSNQNFEGCAHLMAVYYAQTATMTTPFSNSSLSTNNNSAELHLKNGGGGGKEENFLQRDSSFILNINNEDSGIQDNKNLFGLKSDFLEGFCLPLDISSNLQALINNNNSSSSSSFSFSSSSSSFSSTSYLLQRILPSVFVAKGTKDDKHPLGFSHVFLSFNGKEEQDGRQEKEEDRGEGIENGEYYLKCSCGSRLDSHFFKTCNVYLPCSQLFVCLFCLKSSREFESQLKQLFDQLMDYYRNVNVLQNTFFSDDDLLPAASNSQTPPSDSLSQAPSSTLLSLPPLQPISKRDSHPHLQEDMLEFFDNLTKFDVSNKNKIEEKKNKNGKLINNYNNNNTNVCDKISSGNRLTPIRKKILETTEVLDPRHHSCLAYSEWTLFLFESLLRIDSDSEDLTVQCPLKFFSKLISSIQPPPFFSIDSLSTEEASNIELNKNILSSNHCSFQLQSFDQLESLFSVYSDMNWEGYSFLKETFEISKTSPFIIQWEKYTKEKFNFNRFFNNQSNFGKLKLTFCFKNKRKNNKEEENFGKNGFVLDLPEDLLTPS